jgi:hypothetical protein
MEEEMRLNLRRCAETFAEARKIGLATIGRLAAGDWRFFDRLENDEKTFTARKYDDVIAWFSANWPENAEWPSELKRPESPESPPIAPDQHPDQPAAAKSS